MVNFDSFCHFVVMSFDIFDVVNSMYLFFEESKRATIVCLRTFIWLYQVIFLACADAVEIKRLKHAVFVSCAFRV